MEHRVVTQSGQGNRRAGKGEPRVPGIADGALPGRGELQRLVRRLPLGQEAEQLVAEKRFRTQYDVAFKAWLATRPFTNPNAPKGPQYMPQYKPTGAALSKRLDAEADELYAEGQHAGETSDKYIRVTVILASVLFLVGLSSHFPFRSVRIGLVIVGTVLLILAGVQLLQLPGLPA